MIPDEKIVETINHPELVAMRKNVIERMRASGATADLASDTKDEIVQSATDENPNAQADFRRE